MSIWSKIADAAIGLGLGGPLGDLLGRASGESGERNSWQTKRDEVTFTIGVIALSAKMAKADGVVTDDEVTAFQEVFDIPPGEEKNVSRLFNLAKGDVAGFESYAGQLAGIYKDRTECLCDVLEGLFHIASADGVLHPDEDAYLQTVADVFGIEPTRYVHIRARFVRSESDSPYDVLGVDPDIDSAALKKHYHKLVAETHPDRLIARGVPEEFIAVATRKLSAINEAYEQIEAERAGRSSVVSA